MFMELIFALTGLLVLLSVGLLLLKFVFVMILLPFKLMFWLTKGLLGLVIMVPLLLILGTVFLAAMPLTLALAFLPVIIVGGLVAKLVGV